MQRLNNYISASGLCSRRDADQWIIDGRVSVNGVLAVVGMRVSDDDQVLVDGVKINSKEEHVTLLYFKPAGITCTSESDVKGNIIEAINYPVRIFPIGRLDKDSEGLILLTSDGSIVNKILRAENAHEKEYIVHLSSSIKPDFKKSMESGVNIYNPVRSEMTKTLPCRVKIVNDTTFIIVLNQGLNRQIRRMCSALGYHVVRLKRMRVMNFQLGNLKKGEWRQLSRQEVEQLMSLLENQ
ncbi:MAG: pseudouridine synthase [Erysipelotrichaceae bacterium]|nr:pseudouridine synthase [Erysipelotrichaceae bacterium]